jgi:hypothetical protein
MSSTRTAQGKDAQGHQATRAYTRDVTSWPRRLTSLAMVFALSGSPAVFAACMALCLQGTPLTAVSYQGGTPEQHVAHALVPAQAVASVHSHHGSSASDQSAAKATNGASSDPHIGALCHGCCPDGVVFGAGLGVERTGLHGLGAAPMVVAMAPFLLTTPVSGVLPHSPPASPSAPPWALLVLRI